MNQNEKYNNIKIPTELHEVAEDAVARAEREKKRFHFPTGAVSAVAACLAFFVLCNVPTVAASMEKVPVLGTIVQILHVGDGGTVTDGTEGSVSAVNGSVRISFTQDGAAESSVPHFEVVKASAPNRLIITLNGVREFSFANTAEDFKKLPFVRDVYPITYLDDSGFRFAVEMDADADYLVSEYKNPGYIELTLSAKKDAETANVHIVRTKAMAMGEEIAAFDEALSGQSSAVTKTKSGEFCISSTAFSSKAEAERELEKWTMLLGDGAALSVESLKNDELPK